MMKITLDQYGRAVEREPQAFDPNARVATPVRVSVHGQKREYTTGQEQPAGAAEIGATFAPRGAGYAKPLTAAADDLVTVRGVQMTISQAHAMGLLDGLL